VARKFKYCAHCRRTITDSELQRGLYVTSKQGLLCASCARELDEVETEEAAAPAAPSPGPSAREEAAPPAAHPLTEKAADHLQAIREQTESIHRALAFEKTSSWNVVAAVTQCLAVGMLLVAALKWLDGEGSVLNILMATIVFQLMALTFFLKAK